VRTETGGGIEGGGEEEKEPHRDGGG